MSKYLPQRPQVEGQCSFNAVSEQTPAKLQSTNVPSVQGGFVALTNVTKKRYTNSQRKLRYCKYL